MVLRSVGRGGEGEPGVARRSHRQHFSSSPISGIWDMNCKVNGFAVGDVRLW